MQIKIIHCADVHLGKTSSKFNIEKQTKEAFENMINVAEKNKIDFLLIAGDLFHDLKVYDMKVNDIKNFFEKRKFKVIISPGNHDPFTKNSPYSAGNWPENVYIFKENKFNFFEFEDLNTRIWGTAFTEDGNFSGVRTNEIDEKFINILLTHGDLFSEKSVNYNSISKKDIALSKMDYVALGHIHKRTEILKEGDTYYSYPGSLVVTSFKEEGEKGFYIGTISKQECNLAFQVASEMKCLKLEVDITNFKSHIEIANAIIFKIKEINGQDEKNINKNIYKIKLVGTFMSDHGFLEIEEIESYIKNDILNYKIYDETNLPCDNSKNTLKSIFVNKMNSLISQCTDENEKQIRKLALNLALKAFESREVKFNDIQKD